MKKGTLAKAKDVQAALACFRAFKPGFKPASDASASFLVGDHSLLTVSFTGDADELAAAIVRGDVEIKLPKALESLVRRALQSKEAA